MKKIFITTFNKEFFDKYAKKLIESYLDTKQQLPLICYVEDDVNFYPKYKNVIYKNLFDCQKESKKFVERNLKKYEALSKVSYLLNAVKFNYKVFAQSDARKYGDHIFYLDSDTEFLEQIPENWFNLCLPENVFISLYERLGYYTETGFLAFNTTIKNKNNQKLSDIFFKQYTEYYVHDLIYCLPAFTDCHALDATRMRFLLLTLKTNEHASYKENKLGKWSLYDNNIDIMANDNFLNKYLIHKKGKKY